ncbi:hypothetical protein CRUP_019425 [Coryphaenoides rupestris]|nr:hypothetical protein CRUP_019425 [Coryphaenoides rupestris]
MPGGAGHLKLLSHDRRDTLASRGPGAKTDLARNITTHHTLPPLTKAAQSPRIGAAAGRSKARRRRRRKKRKGGEGRRRRRRRKEEKGGGGGGGGGREEEEKEGGGGGGGERTTHPYKAHWPAQVRDIPHTKGRTFPTVNPATGVKICDIQEADQGRRGQGGAGGAGGGGPGLPWAALIGRLSPRAVFLPPRWPDPC